MADKAVVQKKRTKFDFLLSLWAVLAGVFIGGYLGIFQKDIVPYIAPFGKIYLTTLKMCILPILLTAISISLGRLMRSEVANQYLKKMLLIFISAMLILSAVGVIISFIGKPGGNLSEKALETLGSIVQKSSSKPDLEINFSEPYTPAKKVSPIEKFIFDMIPANIFTALSADSNLQVLFFSILFGLGIGFIPNSSAENLFENFDAIYKVFSKLVNWLMYGLPFGLCGLVADQLSKVGLAILLAMTKFVVVVFVCFFIVFVAASIVIWIRSGKSFFKVISALKEPIVIALATGNSLAAIPSTLIHMSEDLGYEKRTVGLLIPLGITVCRYGPILYFAIASMFVVQLYQAPLGLQGLIIVVIGSVFAGMATAGAAGILTLMTLQIVLEPLGLPLDAVLVLFIVVDPLTAPLRSLTNVYVACAGTAMILSPEGDERLYKDETKEKESESQWNGVDRRQSLPANMKPAESS
ncbi:MAG: cation:dicarboxylase symporter family transporter [Desulfobacterales bacterium]|nr:cation:dicarboxylase symporter family transporter [Desulfobacterales bacterium]